MITKGLYIIAFLLAVGFIPYSNIVQASPLPDTSVLTDSNFGAIQTNSYNNQQAILRNTQVNLEYLAALQDLAKNLYKTWGEQANTTVAIGKGLQQTALDATDFANDFQTNITDLQMSMDYGAKSILDHKSTLNQAVSSAASHQGNAKNSATSGMARFLSPLDRNLEQLELQSRKLAQEKLSHKSGGISNSGQFLLAKEAGIQPDRLESDINALGAVPANRRQKENKLTLSDTFEPVSSLSETDLDGYLRHEEQVLILSLLEESRNKSLKKMEEESLRNTKRIWENKKRELLESMSGGSAVGTGRANLSSPFAANISGRISAATPGPAIPLSSNFRLNSKLQSYSKVVVQLNEARAKSGPGNKSIFPMISSLYSACRQTESEKSGISDQVSDCWSMLGSILGEEVLQRSNSNSGNLMEAQFAREYHSERDSSTNLEMRQKMIKGARKYLESQLMKFIEKTIASQPREASMGGRPSAFEKIRGYLNIRLKQYGSWDSSLELVSSSREEASIPIWAFLFFLVRCGQWKEALEVAYKYESTFKAEDKNFVSYLKAFQENIDDHRLPKHLRTQIMVDYTQMQRMGCDRFKAALYKILGRCDLSRKTINDVIVTKEDYMWLQLMLIRETPELDFSTQTYCLSDLQSSLRSFGPVHFSGKGNVNPLNYFQVLLLSLQFERALAYLYESGGEQYQVESVHVAIALAFYGALSVFDDPNIVSVELLKDNGESVQLQYARMIGSFSKLFSGSDFQMAFHYLFALSLIAPVHESYMEYCRTCVCDLALASKEYGFFMGSLRADGSKGSGWLEHFAPLLLTSSDRNEYQRKIVLKAAGICERDGKFEDAMNLYNLASDYTSVLNLLIRQLSDAISDSFSSSSSNRPDLKHQLDHYQETTRNIIAYYETSKRSSISDVSKLDTCHLLLDLCEFFSLFRQFKFEPALNLVLERIKVILPLGQELGNDPSDESGSNQSLLDLEGVKQLDEAVKRHIPDLIIATMICISKQYEALKNSPIFAGGASSGKESKMLWLRKKARNLVTLAGMMPIRMGQEVFAKLNRMDISLG